MNIYVGNISFKASEADLSQAFSEFGEVVSVKIIKDRDTGRSKGFGFVEMVNDDEGAAAIEALNGSEIEGRALRINEARPKPEGGGGGRGGHRGGGRGGHGGGRGHGGGYGDR